MNVKKTPTSVNPQTCIGCGTCTLVYPEGYEMEGVLACPKKNAMNKEKHTEAIKECPVDAISWSESDEPLTP